MSTPSKALVKVAEPSQRLARVRYVADIAADKGKYHAGRTHRYLWNVTKYAGGGVKYSVPGIIRWCRNESLGAAKEAAIRTGQAQRIERVTDKHRNSVLMRVGSVGLPPLFGLATLHNALGNIAYPLFVAPLILALAIIGSRLKGETITEKAPPRRRDLSQEVLDDALQAFKILKTPKHEFDTYATSVHIVKLPRKVTSGNGISAVVCDFDLPAGANATALDVVAKKDLLASYFGISPTQLDLQASAENNARVSLWMADSDPFAGKTVASPYLHDKRTSIWEGVRIGTDARGDAAVIPIIKQSIFIAGLMQQGKTSLGRIFVSVAVLDPYCDLVILDHKGGRDWTPAKKSSARFVSSSEPEEALETYRDLIRQMDERFAIIQRLGDEECPEGAITEKLAEERGMRPVLVLIDELQEAMTACNNKQREEMEGMIGRLTRRGPAAGFIVEVLSQRPDAKGVPMSFRGIAGTKIALPCADWKTSDMILGDGASARGLSAHLLPRTKPGSPARYIATQGPWEKMLKVDFMSRDDFVKICERGYLLRSAAGTLREEKQQAVSNLLDRVIEQLERQDELSPTDLAARLGGYEDEKNPGQKLSTELRAFGLKSHHDGSRRYFRLTDARVTTG